MPSSSRHRAHRLAIVLLALGIHASGAKAQRQPPAPVQGFAVERFYPSAPGGGWLVMDTLDMHGGLGGALSLTLGYARNPLVVRNGTEHLAVVSDQAFAGIGAAATYSRWRLYLNFDFPLVIGGESGTVGGTAFDSSFTAPSVTLASHPDTFFDVRIGLDVRIFGAPEGRFRFGAGAQLLVPSGNRADYDTDGTFRGMVRLLFAGDVGRFAYAAHLGVHIRPLDDSPAPGSPLGSELLFGFAGGAKLPLSIGRSGLWALVIGPEVYGETAFRSFFGGSGTALEGLLSGRIEGTADSGVQLRVKLGTGAGLYQRFGAPEWRLVVGIEVFSRRQPPPPPPPAAVPRG